MAVLPSEVSPAWFFGIDSAFELLSAFIAIFIGYYALKVLRATKREGYLFLSNAFFAVAFSLIARSLTRLALSYNLLQADSPLQYSGYLIYALFMLTGFALLVKLTLDMKRGTTLLFAFVLSIIPLSLYVGYVFFYLGCMILLSYSVRYFFGNYRRSKSKHALLVFLSFLLIFVSQIFFALIEFANIFYVAGHVVRLAGFLILLYNTFLISRAGKKPTEAARK